MIAEASTAPTRPRFPLPRYPTGWFQVAWSSDVEVGQVVPIKQFGQDLVLFRDSKGTVKVLDAFCPHMGAHLGHGGVIKDDELICPFHAWRFDGAGNCTSIPYAKKVPKKAKVPCWPVMEVNGLIMVWHDVDNRAPMWELPELEAFNSDAWSEPLHRQWKFRTHNHTTCSWSGGARPRAAPSPSACSPSWRTRSRWPICATTSTTSRSWAPPSRR